MVYSEPRSVQLVRLPERINLKVAEAANNNNNGIAETFDNAITWFINQRNKNSDKHIFYLSNSSNDPRKSVWVLDSVVLKAKAQADADGQNVRSLILTAIVMYLSHRGVLNDIWRP